MRPAAKVKARNKHHRFVRGRRLFFMRVLMCFERVFQTGVQAGKSKLTESDEDFTNGVLSAI